MFSESGRLNLINAASWLSIELRLIAEDNEHVDHSKCRDTYRLFEVNIFVTYPLFPLPSSLTATVAHPPHTSAGHG